MQRNYFGPHSNIKAFYINFKINFRSLFTIRIRLTAIDKKLRSALDLSEALIDSPDVVIGSLLIATLLNDVSIIKEEMACAAGRFTNQISCLLNNEMF